ncbi:hypothetical protein IVE04_23100 [Pseudomonas mendocina]|nr:hypothetical protein [Pseudomonas mendocina]
MLIRFAVFETDNDSGHSAGALVAAHTLRDEGDLTVSEHRELRVALKWFNDNLPIPEALKDIEHRRAISWFKPEAEEAIKRMWLLKNILEQHGIYIKVLRTEDPGTTLYDDSWQVIAKPYKGQRF